jgi:SAM-dependent methyltransferase
VGLIYPTVRLLEHFSRRYGFAGDLLTIGWQEVYLTADQSLRTFGTDLERTSDGLVKDAALFRTLGFDTVASLDYPGTQDATIEHDLNAPLDPVHFGRYDVVLDVGTLEHVFDAATYMATMARLVRPGGQVLHLSPTQGGTNHGLYCFQPTFFFSYYRTNGFVDLEAHLVELPSTQSDAADERVRVIPIENHNNLDYRPATPQTYLLFRARAGVSPVEPRVPMQEFYERIFQERARLGVDRLPDDVYRSIVGTTPENTYERIMAPAFWV